MLEICRLCLGTENLMWIFDKSMGDNMQEIIEVTCGVKITKSDTVTQMVCGTCCQITIKMFKFRTTSIKNDKDLKAKHAGLSSDAKIKPSSSLQPSVSNAASTSILQVKALKSVSRKSETQQKYKFAHPSIKDIMKKYPTIKLPEMSLKSHYGPYITLLTDEVDDWYREQEFSKTEIQKIKKRALEKLETQENSSTHQQKKKRKTVIGDKPLSVINEVTVKPIIKLNALNIENPGTTKEESSNSKLIKIQTLPYSAEQTDMKIAKKNAENVTEVTKGSTESNIETNISTQLGSLHKNSGIKTIDSAITLSSLLKSSEQVARYNPGKINSNLNPEGTDNEVKNSKNKNTFVIPQLLEKRSFQVKPFVRHTSDKLKKLKSRESVIIFDSDDESNSVTTTKHVNISNETSSSSTTQNVHVCSSHFNNVDENLDGENKKRDFIRSLDLTPKDTANNLDFPLLLPTNKMNTLYRCKICDSHYANRKELQKHYQREHSRCPLCRKKFKDMMAREEHLRNECTAINSFELKHPKLFLMRIDEDEEMRKKYPNAFQQLGSTTAETDICENSSEAASTESTDSTTVQSEVSSQSISTTQESSTCTSLSLETLLSLKPSPTKSAEDQSEKNTVKEEPTGGNYDAETANAVREIEKFLDNAPTSSSSDQKMLYSFDAPATAAESIAESSSSNNPDIICISDDDSEVSSKPNIEVNPKRVFKIVNNEYLKYVNSHDNDVSILRKILSAPAAEGKTGGDNVKIPLLQDSNIVDGGSSKIRIFKNLRKYLQDFKIPIEISYGANLNVYIKNAKSQNRKKTIQGIWSYMIPQDLRPVGTTTASQEMALNNTSILNKSSVIVQSQQKIAPKTMLNPNIPSAYGGIERQRTAMHITQLNNVQKTVPSSTGLLLTSHCPVVNTPQISSTITNNTPMILNGPQNMYVGSSNNSYTNLLIALPTSMVTTTPNTTVTSLPTTPGHLPVIQSVISGSSLGSTPTNNSNSTLSISLPSNQSVQPSIRVKTVSELS